MIYHSHIIYHRLNERRIEIKVHTLIKIRILNESKKIGVMGKKVKKKRNNRLPKLFHSLQKNPLYSPFLTL